MIVRLLWRDDLGRAESEETGKLAGGYVVADLWTPGYGAAASSSAPSPKGVDPDARRLGFRRPPAPLVCRTHERYNPPMARKVYGRGARQAHAQGARSAPLIPAFLTPARKREILGTVLVALGVVTLIAFVKQPRPADRGLGKLAAPAERSRRLAPHLQHGRRHGAGPAAPLSAADAHMVARGEGMARLWRDRAARTIGMQLQAGRP